MDPALLLGIGIMVDMYTHFQEYNNELHTGKKRYVKKTMFLYHFKKSEIKPL